MGFNPSDEGFPMAMSRRLLSGEFPHRDFISIRAAGSALLHVPLVALGGGYAIWWSRWFYWAQWAAIAWLWVDVAARALQWSASAGQRLALCTLVFLLASPDTTMFSTFFLNGLLLASFGIWCGWNSPPRMRPAAYALVSLGALCKQNYLLFLPLLMIALDDWRNWRCWLGGVLPIALYGVACLLAGALPACWQQMTAHDAEVGALGTFNYVGPIWKETLVLATAIAVAAGSFFLRKASRAASIVLLLTWVLLVVVQIGSRQVYFSGTATGLMLGSWLAWLLHDRQRHREAIRLGFLALGMAWCVAISRGNNSTSYATCCIDAVLLVFWWHVCSERLARWNLRRPLPAALLLTVVVSCPLFYTFVTMNLYHEPPQYTLTMPLGDVMAGGSGIYVDAATYALVEDLQRAQRSLGDGRYAIAPDFAAWWIEAPQRNPLPSDWLLSYEVPPGEAQSKLFDAIEKLRGSTTFIVQKYRAEPIAWVRRPFLHPTHDRPALDWIRDHLQPVGETRYFMLYR